MTKDDLQSKTKEDVFEFICHRLSFDEEIQGQLRKVNDEDFKKEHRRFSMSGYESKTGQSTKFNLAILNEFADLGIYDYTNYLFLDFYKGNGTLYYRYWGEDENHEIDFYGLGTTDIVYKIFEITIFSNRHKRRRI